MPLSPSICPLPQTPSSPTPQPHPSQPLLPSSLPPSPRPATTTPPPVTADSLYSSSSRTSPSQTHNHQSRHLSPLPPSSPEPQANLNSLQHQQPSSHPPHQPATSSRSKRRITKTRVFEINDRTIKRPHAASRFVHGRGIRLSNIPNIVYALDKASPNDPYLELLHRVLFNCAGQLARRISNIRTFNGFAFRSQRERELVREKLLRAHFAQVKRVAQVLDIDVAESKESTAHAILAFLEVPRLVEGRGNKEQREKTEKSYRKKLERERAKAAKQRKKEEEERNIAQQAALKEEDSDEDGDVDLESEALSWIEIAQIRRQQRSQNGPHDRHRPAGPSALPADNHDVLAEPYIAPALAP